MLNTNNDVTRQIEDLDAEIQEASRTCDFATAKRLKKKRDKLARKAAGKAPARGRASLTERDGSTRRVVDFQALSTEGIMRVDDSHYACALEVDDVNYLSARPDEQGDVRDVWSAYLNSLDHTVEIQVHLASRRISDEEFIEMVDLEPVFGDEAGNLLRSEIEAYCRQKLEGSSRSMSRTRLVVIKVQAPTREKAVPSLVREAERVIRCLRDLSSDARVLEGQAWLDAICSITHPDDEPGVVNMGELTRSVGLTARDLAAPSSIERVDAYRGDSRLMVGGRRWVKSYVMTLDGYGNSMRDNFITDLSSLPYDIAVSWHIRPWETDAAISAVETNLTRVTEENDAYKKNRSDPMRGYFVDETNLPPRMQDNHAQAQALRDDIVNFDMRSFSVTTVVLVSGRTEEELEAACKEVESVFSAHRKPLPDSWSALREQSLTAALPIGNCALPYGRTLTTEPLAHMLMWASAELLDRGGTLMGINPYTRGFELYDPALEEHTNSFTLAMPRSGKSMNAKLTRIIQTHLRRPDDDVIIIDPENEYSACTQMLGGQVINISETSDEHINPLDISAYYGSENPDSMTNPVPSKVSFIQALIHMMASQVTDIQTNLIDQAARVAYSRWQADPRDANVPTLSDIYAFLTSVEGSAADDARQLAQMIQRFVDGTLSVFNHQTNVDISNRLVDFVLSDLSAELKPIAMLVMLDHIWVRVTANRSSGRRTWLIIDEFQLLLDDPYAVDKFDRFFTRGGKWDLYNLGITQNLSRLLDIPQTRYMLQNCPFLTIMKQSPDGAREIAELLGLSSAQERFLRTAGRGQGLYVFKNMIVPFDFTIDEKTCPKLYALATTKPDDLRRLRAAAAAAPQTSSAVEMDLDEPDAAATAMWQPLAAPEPVSAPSLATSGGEPEPILEERDEFPPASDPEAEAAPGHSEPHGPLDAPAPTEPDDPGEHTRAMRTKEASPWSAGFAALAGEPARPETIEPAASPAGSRPHRHGGTASGLFAADEEAGAAPEQTAPVDERQPEPSGDRDGGWREAVIEAAEGISTEPTAPSAGTHRVGDVERATRPQPTEASPGSEEAAGTFTVKNPKNELFRRQAAVAERRGYRIVHPRTAGAERVANGHTTPTAPGARPRPHDAARRPGGIDTARVTSAFRGAIPDSAAIAPEAERPTRNEPRDRPEPKRTHVTIAERLLADEEFAQALMELVEERTSNVDVEASFHSMGGISAPRRGPEPEDGFAAVPTPRGEGA